MALYRVPKPPSGGYEQPRYVRPRIRKPPSGGYEQPRYYSPPIVRPPTPTASPPLGPPMPTRSPPDYLGQATTQARGIIDPQLRYLADRYNAQMMGVSGAFRGITDQYASQLGGIAAQTGAMYDQAKGPVSAAAAGINSQLTNLGKTQAGTESAAMARAGLPGGGNPDINLAGGGAGAGQAAGAIGDAIINALSQSQKAALEYAGKLPGFAQAQGEYQTRTVLAQLAGEMAQQMAQTTAQIPQLTFTIYQSLLDRAQTDRQFAEQVREFNVQQNQQRAGVKGPNAPTVAGRIAYWTDVAAQRTQDTGVLWKGTSTGIRPVTDAKGRRISTLQGQAASYALGKTQAQIAQGDARIRIAQQNADTARRRAAQPKQPTNTGPYYRNPTTGQWELKPGYKIVNGEVAKATSPKAQTTITGSAPIRVSPRKWRTRSGRALSPAGNAYWEHMWKTGRTDGRGKIKPPSQTGGSTSGGLLKKKTP